MKEPERFLVARCYVGLHAVTTMVAPEVEGNVLLTFSGEEGVTKAQAVEALIYQIRKQLGVLPNVERTSLSEPE